MSEELSLKAIQKSWPQTLRLYLKGFFGSLFLTCLSFSLAAAHVFSPSLLIAVLVLLAVIQASVQLVYFMHLGKESKPRWMTVVFYFMILVVIIVVLGSLWIMSDLDYRVMPQMEGME